MQLAAAGGALLGLEFGLVRFAVPIGDEGAVGGTGDGVLEDGGLWGEEAGDEVDIVARGGDDDAAVAEVDLVEFGAIDCDIIQGRLVGVDEAFDLIKVAHKAGGEATGGREGRSISRRPSSVLRTVRVPLAELKRTSVA